MSKVLDHYSRKQLPNILYINPKPWKLYNNKKKKKQEKKKKKGQTFQWGLGFKQKKIRSFVASSYK